jgi:AraC-like DNA-binding protein
MRILIAQNRVGLATYPPGATFGPRVIRDFEFVWIIEGETVWQVDGKDVPAPSGTILLARPGMHDGFRWDPQHQTRHAFLHFSIEGKPPRSWPSLDEWPLAIQLPEGDILRPLFRHIAWLTEGKPSGWEDLAQSAVQHLLAAYVLNATRTQGSGGGELPEPVERALSAVQREWGHGPLVSPTLQQMARAAAVSPGHLCRLFQKTFGHGPLEALRLIRLDRAAQMLARTNARVGEVADATGFVSAFHFSRAFKDVFGCSPRAFRRNLDQQLPVPLNKLTRVRQLAARLWGEG